MCTGRVDLAFILRALLKGKDGVIIGGCWPGECHYITEGNFLALGTMHLCRKILELIGLSPERVRLEWVSASEGSRFAEIMNGFSKKIRELGPLGEGEGIDPDVLKQKLEAVQNLVPYIKLVERERLRMPLKSVEAYNEFFAGDAFDRLFKDLIADKLEISRMMALLREKPRSAGELSNALGISPSEVSRHLNASARQGLGRYDESKNLIAAACNENGEKSSAPAPAAAMNNDKINALIDEYQGKPGSLIHVLMEIQSQYHWLPKDILDRVSEKLQVPLSRVMQIATFYKTFSLTPRGRHEVHVCTGTSCHMRGSSHLLATLQDLIGIRPGETDANSTFSLGGGNCLGCCTLGPEIIVDGKHHGRLTPAKVEDALKIYA
jgi:F420-non-reducing hydrogenase iron-sulfur subunit